MLYKITQLATTAINTDPADATGAGASVEPQRAAISMGSQASQLEKEAMVCLTCTVYIRNLLVITCK